MTSHAGHLEASIARVLAANGCRQVALEGWFRVVNDKQLAWNDFHDVKATYAVASLVGECVVFNIGGNKFGSSPRSTTSPTTSSSGPS